jgi:ligand-binding sensor domain-containing protein
MGTMSTFARTAALSCALITSAVVPTLRGQRPGPAVGELDHAVWTTRDGAPSGVTALAQSADGVLWIGTTIGLYQFDGLRFERFEPPASQPLPSRSIKALLPLPDGTLWIGYSLGGASALTHGRVVNYSQQDGLPEGPISAFARDSTGDIWLSASRGLARLHSRRWQRIGPESGFPGGKTPELFVDRRGTLWVHTNTGIFVLPRGASRFVRQGPPLDPASSRVGMSREAPDGSVWGVSPTLGLTRLSDSTGRVTPQQAAAERVRDAFMLEIDRHANAWMTGPGGLVRVPLGTDGGADPISHAMPKLLPVERVPLNNVSYPNAVLRDREGNVWVGTDRGIERFRETKLTPLMLAQPVAGLSLAPSVDGSMWMASVSEPPRTVGDRVISHAGPADITCTYRDLRGGVWFGGPSGLWHVSSGDSPAHAQPTRFPLPSEPGPGDVQSIAQTLKGDVWVSIRGEQKRGVFRRRRGAWSRASLPPAFSDQLALTVVADSANRVWLGYGANRLVLVDGDSTTVYSDPEGLHVGNVTALFVRGAHLWIGGDSGLMMTLDGERFRSIGATESLLGITGIVETADGNLWLSGAGGVTHIDAAEVSRALESSTYRARAERFDAHDGLSGRARKLRPVPTAIQGTDGRLWFLTETGASWIDPTSIQRNTLPPPVQIRAVTTGGTRYNADSRVTLPARTSQFQIAYTALSLSTPDRVRFRYRLAGAESTWVDAGTNREASYSNLEPGAYRFQVIAANEDGVWNETGAVVEVEIPLMFVQTKAFIALMVLIAVCAGWLVVRRGRPRVVRALRVRLASEVRASSPDELPPLHAQLEDAAREAFAKSGIAATVQHEGLPRSYPPSVGAQILGIATEAMANVRKHAACRTVKIDCNYTGRELHVRVRDDGLGFDPKQTAPGHVGLARMRERAASIGAKLSVASAKGGGTEVLLTVPGGPGRWTWWQGMTPVLSKQA